MRNLDGMGPATWGPNGAQLGGPVLLSMLLSLAALKAGWWLAMFS